MHLSKFLLTALSTLLAAPVLVQGFDIPADAPDGIYSVPISKNGTGLAEPTFLAPVINNTKIERDGGDGVAKRSIPNPVTGCDGYGISSQDYSNAYGNWWAVCQGNWVAPNTLFYVKWGWVVVYMCNYGGWNPCWESESLEAHDLINSWCGFNIAGWVLIQDWAKGYGRSASWIGICSWQEVPA